MLGLSGALVVGAGCSASPGLVALWLARPQTDAIAERSEAAGSAAEPVVRRRRRQGRARYVRLALTVAFISGLTSLGYQVTWTRLLASGTGNTTYVFTTILAMFLVGIAIGAVLFTVLQPRRRSDPASGREPDHSRPLSRWRSRLGPRRTPRPDPGSRSRP